MTEKCHGESPEARIALRGMSTQTHLALCVCQQNRNLGKHEGVRTEMAVSREPSKVIRVNLNLPRINAGKPQRADGAVR